MNHKVAGTMLIDGIVYIFCFSLFSVLCMFAVAKVLYALQTIHIATDRTILVTNAYDWIRNDIQLLDPDDAISVHTHGFGIAKKNEKIMWKVHDARLVRTLQRHDARNNRWKQPHISLVAEDIHALHVHLTKRATPLGKKITAITYRLQTHDEYVQNRYAEHTITLRNGIIDG